MPFPNKKTQFKKGQSGNPKGPTPKLPEIDALMAEVLGTVKAGSTEAKLILLALTKAAKKGNTRAAEILLNRGYGQAKQNIAHTVDGNSLVFKTIPTVPLIENGDS